MDRDNEKVVVIGAGISGLTIASRLKKAGREVIVIEAGSEAGGSMKTERQDGFLADFGPNSGMETTPEIGRLVDELRIRGEMVYASEEAKKRYILKNDQLIPLPTSPGAFIKTRLFSPSAKLRLLKEPFISGGSGEESLAQFVRRRLGREFLDYAVNPFVAGVFAGDPEKLSVRAAFPKLYNLEKKYGGLIKGTIRGARERKRNPEKSKAKARMFSFKGGMQFLIQRLAESVGNDRIMLKSEALSIERAGKGYVVTLKTDGGIQKLHASRVISAIPAFQAARLIKALDDDLSKSLSEVYYPPVMTLFLGFRKAAVTRPLDGFGFLIPAREKKKILGAIWNSVIFPARAPEDHVAFTLFVGGSRDAQLFSWDENTLVNQAVLEFKHIMNMKEPPVFIRKKIWRRAIPQYNLGHLQLEERLQSFEKTYPGISLTGNYRGGISLADCISNSSEIAERILRNE